MADIKADAGNAPADPKNVQDMTQFVSKERP